MLGVRQHVELRRALRSSTATWKVIVNEVPIQQYYALPYDRWEGYAAERERLLRFLRDVKNVVFLTTDTHANLVNEVRSRSLSERARDATGSGRSSRARSPRTRSRRRSTTSSAQKGAGTAIGALFFKPAPPNGLGMRCAALDTYSYAQVTVTARRFTVAMKDAKGQPVREATGVACAPLVLTAR